MEYVLNDTKKFYVATAQNYGEIHIAFYTDPLAYGRAVKEAMRQHEDDDIDVYIHGDNNVGGASATFGGLYIATMGDVGLNVDFYDDLEKYNDELVAIENEELVGDIDTVTYNGPDVVMPDVEDDEDNGEIRSNGFR